MAMPQRDETIEEIKRLEPSSRSSCGERPHRSRRLRPQARHARTRNHRPPLQAVCGDGTQRKNRMKLIRFLDLVKHSAEAAIE